MIKTKALLIIRLYLRHVSTSFVQEEQIRDSQWRHTFGCSGKPTHHQSSCKQIAKRVCPRSPDRCNAEQQERQYVYLPSTIFQSNGDLEEV